MILDAESWMNIRRFRALHTAGATYTEIAAECGVDWRTVKKYLAVEGVALPPRAPSRAGTQPSLIEPFTEVIDTWLRADLTLKGSVVHERLVAEYRFTGHYQRVKMYLASARPRIAVSRSRPPAFVEALAAELDAELVPMGSAGVKVMSVVRNVADAYVHAGGQYQWDNAAPVAVARAAGLHCSRVDGSPLVYNEDDTSLPDLIVCRPELAEQIVDFVRRNGTE